ncbi:MAG: UspA domain protein [Pseudonocardiales bacterium]|nr:UspA domain protein [Pseudonocardiales bacterium]
MPPADQCIPARQYHRPIFELGTDGPARILVGVDGTDTSLRAAAYAGGLARRQGAELIVLYVAAPGMAAGVAATAGVLVQTQASIADDLRAQLEQAQVRLGIKSTFVRRDGNPYVELIRVAEEMRVDAVVVGASMSAGHRLVGSLAGRLVRDAKWPVTVVP